MSDAPLAQYDVDASSVAGSAHDVVTMPSHAIHPACHKLGKLGADAPILQSSLVAVRDMRGFQTASFDPQTLVLLETAFDEAWLTLKAIGNQTVRPDELARSMLRLAMEGERDPVRLHDGALKGLLPAAAWRDAG
jgi:hypothetical protein